MASVSLRSRAERQQKSDQHKQERYEGGCEVFAKINEAPMQQPSVFGFNFG
jgi:hypothetical protein